MAKFLLGLLSGIILCIIAGLILVFVVVRIASSFSERPPEIADGSTLIFNLEGDVPEKAPPELGFPLLEDQATHLTVEQVWETFRKAAADSRIKAIIFEPRALNIGWGKMQEIRQEMLDFRKSGKPLIALLRGAGSHEYYVATAADRIYMTPEDVLDVKGLRLEGMFFKNTLDKIGVRVDVVHAGKYKDAGDIFTRTSMSPETEEVLNQVLDQYYADLVDVISTGRKKDPQQVRASIDNGPFVGKEALDAGFVDVLGFEDEVIGDLEKRLGQKSLKKVSIRSYARATLPTTGPAPKRIAFIVGEGDIVRSSQSDTLGSLNLITSGGFSKLLRQVENDSSIKGAILRIDSPGGDAVASDDILNAARDLSHSKPVVISMGDVAASGGYFISMTGDPIAAYGNTLTGSIGVLFIKPDLHGLYDKLGITKQALQRGQNADLYSDYEPLTGKNLDRLRSQIDSMYAAFLSRVARGRKRPVGQIEPLAQGRVWTGAQAKQNGLVDQLGGIDTAIDMIRTRAKIGPSEKVTLVVYPPKKSLLEVLMNRNDETATVEAKLKSLLGGLPIQAIANGGFQRLMPFAIQVR